MSRNSLAIILLILFFSCSQEKTNKTEEEPIIKDTIPAIPEMSEKIEKVKEEPYWDALAEFFAGEISDEPLLQEKQQTRFYASYKATINKMWQQREKKFIIPLRKWAKEEMSAEHSSGKAVFYPFSGPDFLTIYALFPKAKSYTLLGLEPEGHLNNYRNFGKYTFWMKELNILTKALDDIMQLSFFKTKDMAKELKYRYLDGTTSILLFFMKKYNLKILNTERIYIDDSLNIKVIKDSSYSFTPWDTILTGVRIYFQDSTKEIKKLIYLSQDASDNLQSKDSTLILFVKKNFPQGANTFIKSASYLMYKPYFSKIKNTILQVSDFLLQDDSGMPIYNFPAEKWELKFYGNYERPIPLFYNWYQKDLRKIYKSDTTIKPLAFGIGYYVYSHRSNLMIARKKK